MSLRGRPRRRRSRSSSRSESPDPEVTKFLSEQARPMSPNSERHRQQRIAMGGVSNVKSRHELEREEAERRKKEEEERTAKAYQEFLEHMGAEPSAPRPQSSGGFVRAGGSAYTPEARRHDKDTSASSTVRKQLTSRSAFGPEDEDPVDSASTSRSDVIPKRKGVMQDFLGEIQRNQAIREERLRSQINTSSSVSSLLAQEMLPNKLQDTSDSCNVCILNLPANVSEASFGEYFTRYGDVGSVKIMWPRTEDSHSLASAVRTTRQAGATGFVNFMRRADAQSALKEADGSVWNGSELRTSWGKSLSKPLHAMFSKREHNNSQEVRVQNSNVQDHGVRKRRSSRSPSSRHHRRPRERSVSPRSVLRQQILENSGREVEGTIVSLAHQVRNYGTKYEGMVREREVHNPSYAFLRDRNLPEHEYYKMAIDANYVPILPTKFVDEGDASLYSSDTEEDSEWEKLQGQDRPDALGKAACRRLDAMLRSITLRRERIARAMTFAIEHATAAEAVTSRLISSLLLPSTPLPRKLARLYVVSDILHNSTASGAWRYRALFESRLDAVFLHWGDISNSFGGRMKRESCKDMARNVLYAWETWMVFESSRLSTWRDFIDNGSEKVSVHQKESNVNLDGDGIPTIDKSIAEEKKKKKKKKNMESAGAERKNNDSDGVDIDGEDIGEDIDGEDIDGEDIDGEDIDGEDIDGEGVDDMM